MIMKNNNTYKLFILSAILILGLYALGCTEEETPMDEEEDLTENPVVDITGTVDVTDANAVTTALQVSGATVQTGNPPAPSTDPGTPVILDEDFSVVSGQMGSATIAMEVEAESISGFYFQVNGASSYLDIPASIANGRVAVEEVTYFNLGLADAFVPGTFCGQVCVYDEESRVSQPIEVCVEVVALGGKGSSFLIGKWSLVSTIEDGQTIAVGELTTYTETFECGDGTIAEVSITERTDFIDVTFNDKGEVVIDGEEYYKYEQTNSSDCQIDSEEGTDQIDGQGIWTYDMDKSTLTMVLEFANNDVGQEVVVFDVERDEEQVKLTFQEGGGDDNETLVFEKK